LGFHLTEGQASDLEGADELLPTVVAKTLLADKAYDADGRVIEPLKASGKKSLFHQRKTEKSQESMTRNYTKLVIE
jgi:IS5 family transposase